MEPSQHKEVSFKLIPSDKEAVELLKRIIGFAKTDAYVLTCQIPLSNMEDYLSGKRDDVITIKMMTCKSEEG